MGAKDAFLLSAVCPVSPPGFFQYYEGSERPSLSAHSTGVVLVGRMTGLSVRPGTDIFIQGSCLDRRPGVRALDRSHNGTRSSCLCRSVNGGLRRVHDLGFYFRNHRLCSGAMNGDARSIRLPHNARELIKMLGIIEATRLDLLKIGWRNRTCRALGHHVRRIGVGSDFVYHDPFMRLKIDEVTARLRATAVGVVPVDALAGWEHDEEGVNRVQHDTSRDYRPGVTVYPPPLPKHPFVSESMQFAMKVYGDTNDSI